MSISPELARWRKAQRHALIARRLAAAPDARRGWNEKITQLLGEAFPLLERMVIGFCWPYQGEFDARFAIRALRAAGARAALPAVVAKNTPLQFREWWPGVAMTPGVFGLPVPADSAVVVPDALLIPPVGFGERGDRLGYGGGYFDRTLASISPQPLKIGVGYELSRIETTFPQPHDVLMDFIVTEAGIHAVGGPRLTPIEPRKCIALAGEIAAERALPRAQPGASSELSTANHGRT